jgi:F0F1-type ATP synthase assembly protein I
MSPRAPQPTRPSPASGRGPGSDPDPSGGAGFGRYAGLGLQFGAVITVLALAGAWADSKLGSAPWLLLGGVALGFFGATLSLVRHVPSSSSKPGAKPRDPA